MPITKPVISQYDPIYWVRLMFFPVLIIGCIYIIFINHVLFSRNPLPAGQNLVVNIVLSILSIVFYRMLFLRSFPKRILVTVESITIDEYRLAKFKRVIIKYADIKDTGTYRQQGESNTPGRFGLQPETLTIELYNGDSYEISENDFANYNNLKSAIYDHLFRHK